MNAPKLVLDLSPRQLLECRLCHQPISADRQLRFNSILVLSYKMCPSCRQQVSDQTKNEYWYRSRWYRFMKQVAKRRGWDYRP